MGSNREIGGRYFPYPTTEKRRSTNQIPHLSLSHKPLVLLLSLVRVCQLPIRLLFSLADTWSPTPHKNINLRPPTRLIVLSCWINFLTPNKSDPFKPSLKFGYPKFFCQNFPEFFKILVSFKNVNTSSKLRKNIHPCLFLTLLLRNLLIRISDTFLQIVDVITLDLNGELQKIVLFFPVIYKNNAKNSLYDNMYAATMYKMRILQAPFGTSDKMFRNLSTNGVQKSKLQK